MTNASIPCLSRITPAAAALVLAITAGSAGAASLTVEITNEQAADGFYLTPLVAMLHDGTLDAFDPGSPASAGLEAIAEDGDPAAFIGANPGENISVITSPGGFPGAPVIDPGETASARIAVADTLSDRFFSFLSMVIPSNDTFIGNANPMAYEIFGPGGAYLGPTVIQVFGANLWESGTETDDGMGAAFSALGGVSSDQFGVVQAAMGTLDVLLGTGTAAGSTIGAIPGAGDLIATITVSQVPLPAAFPLMVAALGGLAFVCRREARTV